MGAPDRPPLRARFVRTVGERDRVYVRRSDGSETSWEFASYGEGLPHDLVHVVVERDFGVREGFWGRVNRGVAPARITEEANRLGGKDKYAGFGPDQRELLIAEALAAAAGGYRPDLDDAAQHAQLVAAYAGVGLPVPGNLTVVGLGETVGRLRELQVKWQALVPKGTLELEFPG
ncbi:MAG TPA: hypothetical protein VFY71_10725 [Planctomycetota bacterium]|nr:hypothetical protein [Planctomycetota bacterium]